MGIRLRHCEPHHALVPHSENRFHAIGSGHGMNIHGHLFLMHNLLLLQVNKRKETLACTTAGLYEELRFRHRLPLGFDQLETTRNGIPCAWDQLLSNGDGIAFQPQFRDSPSIPGIASRRSAP